MSYLKNLMKKVFAFLVYIRHLNRREPKEGLCLLCFLIQVPEITTKLPFQLYAARFYAMSASGENEKAGTSRVKVDYSK